MVIIYNKKKSSMYVYIVLLFMCIKKLLIIKI